MAKTAKFVTVHLAADNQRSEWRAALHTVNLILSKQRMDV